MATSVPAQMMVRLANFAKLTRLTRLTRLTKLAAPLAAVPLLTASIAAADEIQNLTGLPVYPNLSAAAMDRVSRTDTLGRRCSRFAAETSYPLDLVEAWYRKALLGASETDLTHDETYRIYARLSGIKVALGVDYVTVFRAANQASTSIELFRCSALK